MKNNVRKKLVVTVIGSCVIGLNACNSGGAGSNSGKNNITPSSAEVSQVSYALDSSNKLYLSEKDGLWSEVDAKGLPESGNSIYTMNCSDGLCAVATAQGVSISKDFKNWVNPVNVNPQNQLQGKSLKMSAALYDVIVSGNQKVVGVGPDGVIEVNLNHSAKSNKAVYLTRQLTTLQDSKYANLYSIAYGNNSYIAVGRDGNMLKGVLTKIAGDNNAITWSSVNDPLVKNSLHRVRFVNGQFMAVGTNGTILSSTTGDVWQQATLTTKSTDFLDFNYGNWVYVAVGTNGVINYSTDGNSWIQAVTPSTINGKVYDIFDLTYNPGFGFMASVAYQDKTPCNILLTSTNGYDWKMAQVGANSVQANGKQVQGFFSFVTKGLGMVWTNRALIMDVVKFAHTQYKTVKK